MHRRRQQLGRRLLAAGLLAALAPAVAEAAVVRFRSSATASGPLVTLADVAEVSSAISGEAEELGRIGLAPAPAPGATVRIDFDTIRARLTARGVNVASIEFAGSSAVAVTTPAPQSPASERLAPPPLERITPAQRQRAEALVAEAIRARLERAAPDLGRVQIALRLENEHVATALHGASAGFEVLGGGEPWSEPQHLTLRTLDRRNEIREFPVMCRLSPFPFALAARHSLPRGHVIAASDLAWRQTESTSGLCTEPGRVIGQEVQAPLRADELLREGTVRPLPLVRANDTVTVYARRGGIAVKRQLRARSDGALGETVTLATPDGRQTLVARVIGHHEAELPGPADTPLSEISDTSGRIRFESGADPRIAPRGAIVQTSGELTRTARTSNGPD